MSDIVYLTEEGMADLKRELEDKRGRGRREASAAIAEAREKGDLSENAEYDAAKDAQGLLEAKISRLEDMLGRARIIDATKIDTSKVMVMSKVEIKNVSTGKEVTYILVSEKEANVKESKISVNSPIGKGLLGKKIGEIAKVTTPAATIEFEILSISLQ